MTGQIQKVDEGKQYLTIKQALENSRAAIADVIPKSLDADRLLNLSLLSIRKTPALMACPISSLLACVVEASRLGLEIGGGLGQSYLVPFKENGQPMAQMIIGYRGFVELMRRGGQVTTIRAVVVHARDTFEILEGLEQSITHRPYLDGDPGELRYVYAVAKFAGTNDYQAVWLSKSEVDRTRARSRAGANGPWVTDYEEMAKKTAVRRLAKLMPLTIDAAEAIERDDERSLDLEATAEQVSTEVTAPSVKASMAAKRKLNIDTPPLNDLTTSAVKRITERPADRAADPPSEPPADLPGDVP